METPLNYTTSDGDTADYIAWKHYGTTEGRVTEQLLEANRGLADQGPTLPAGLAVRLPVIAPDAKKAGVRLWD